MTGASAGPLRFAGYAALFDIADAAHDTIRPGAFAQTLRKPRRSIPLFWQHRSDAAIGMIETIAEDSRGLRVIGQIDNPHGRAAQMLKRGEVSGLSFGYRASGYQRSERGRILTEIDLFEVSLVTHPLQHGARVHFVAQDPPRSGEDCLSQSPKERLNAPWKHLKPKPPTSSKPASISSHVRTRPMKR